MNTLLIISALAPAILIFIYIYKKDRIEKEPIGLLLLLVLFGALSTIPACIIELIAGRLLDSVLEPDSLLSMLISNFFIIAVAEEFFKRLAVKPAVWYNKAFNYRFDAIVYCVCAALGFAALENVLYVLQYGFETALLRAALAVPMHAFCGVFMGLYIGNAKACEVVGNAAGCKRYLALSFWVPVFMHGFYDFCASAQQDLLAIAFIVFVIFMYVFSIIKIKRAAAADSSFAADWMTAFGSIGINK